MPGGFAAVGFHSELLGAAEATHPNGRASAVASAHRCGMFGTCDSICGPVVETWVIPNADSVGRKVLRVGQPAFGRRQSTKANLPT